MRNSIYKGYDIDLGNKNNYKIYGIMNSYGYNLDANNKLKNKFVYDKTSHDYLNMNKGIKKDKNN